MHIRENQQLKNRHFKPFLAVLFLKAHLKKKIIKKKNKTSTTKTENPA